LGAGAVCSIAASKPLQHDLAARFPALKQRVRALEVFGIDGAEMFRDRGADFSGSGAPPSDAAACAAPSATSTTRTTVTRASATTAANVVVMIVVGIETTTTAPIRRRRGNDRVVSSLSGVARRCVRYRSRFRLAGHEPRGLLTQPDVGLYAKYILENKPDAKHRHPP
jgi:hypothetical protein